MFRIQKLLLSEYKNVEEAVLVENPFAQVNELGIGIKAVQIALTTTKLIIGSDTFDATKTETLSNVTYDQQDPEIETMELLSMLPLEFLYIKVFRKGCRQLMKVVVGSSKVLWFEFGGHILRNMYWNVWRDRISALHSRQSEVAGVIPTYPLPSATYEATSASTSDQEIPEPQQVIAVVHREDSELNQKLGNTSCLLKVKDWMGSYKRFPKSNTPEVPSKHSKGHSNSTVDLEKCDQEIVLREVAEYFLETQSDIIVGQHTFGYDSCRDFLFRSASIANLMSGRSNSFGGY